MLQELRDEGPVVTVAGGLRYVTRYAEARAVLRDTETFSNASGMKAPGVVDPGRGPSPRRARPAAPHRGAARHGHRDDAEGRARGRAVHRRDAPRRCSTRSRPTGFDLVASYTAVLPNRVTMHLLGFEPADADQLARWAKELMESTFPALQPHRARRRVRGRVPRVRGLHRRTHRGTCARNSTAGENARRRARPADPPRSRRRTAAPQSNCARSSGTSSPAGSRRRASSSATCCYEILQPTRPRRGGARRPRPAHDRDRGEPPPHARRSCSWRAAACATPTSAAVRCTRASGSSSVPRRRTATSGSSTTPTSSASIAPTPINTSRSGTARTCARARRSPVPSRASASSAVLDRFAPGELRLEPGFVFEQVPTYFEHGPRRLPVVRGAVRPRSPASQSRVTRARRRSRTPRRRPSRSSSPGRSSSGSSRRSATARGSGASEPRKCASPNVKTPPSDATIQ